MNTEAIMTVNPATEEVVARFEPMSSAAIHTAISQAQDAFELWSQTSLPERMSCIQALAGYFESYVDELAALVTLEMGKPITQARAEIAKCATTCRYYAEHGLPMLASREIAVGHARARIHYRPLGIILAIMPWNFPFWQVVRPGIPALMAGNAILLKHAPNVPQCALALEQALVECGFPKGLLTTLLVGVGAVPDILADDRVRAVTLTGSERAGAVVAAAAGQNIKPSVLELGGSDAFIVCEDADVERSAALAVRARTQNAGQSCIASKRFLVARPILPRFLDAFSASMRKLRLDDPQHAATEIGPLARRDLLDGLERQVKRSVAAGARVVTGGVRPDRKGYFFEPTILADLPDHAPAWIEETFGPVAAVTAFGSEDSATALANASRYGLGATICTSDQSRAERIAESLDVGMVFVNALVASDPRLPFGGVKKSGYGRELSEYGAREFTNIKTVYVADQE